MIVIKWGHSKDNTSLLQNGPTGDWSMHFWDSSLMPSSHSGTTWCPRLLLHSSSLALGWMGWNRKLFLWEYSSQSQPLHSPFQGGAVSVLGEKPNKAKDFNREWRKHTHWGSHSNIIMHRQQPISVGACLSSLPPQLVTEWMHSSVRSGVGWGQKRVLEWKKGSWGSCFQMLPQLAEGSWSNVLSLISGSLSVKWEDRTRELWRYFLIFFDYTITETLLLRDRVCQDLLYLRKMLWENEVQEGKVIL